MNTSYSDADAIQTSNYVDPMEMNNPKNSEQKNEIQTHTDKRTQIIKHMHNNEDDDYNNNTNINT